MKVMSIFGTRPEMIKMWGTLKKLDELNFEHVMVHTGHRSKVLIETGDFLVGVLISRSQ